MEELKLLVEMVANLYADNMKVYTSIKIARDIADKYGENGLVNFL